MNYCVLARKHLAILKLKNTRSQVVISCGFSHPLIYIMVSDNARGKLSSWRSFFLKFTIIYILSVMRSTHPTRARRPPIFAHQKGR